VQSGDISSRDIEPGSKRRRDQVSRRRSDTGSSSVSIQSRLARFPRCLNTPANNRLEPARPSVCAKNLRGARLKRKR
jgi:hypothetical protein